MKIADLSINKKNPRKITKERLEALKASIEKFGDLSGFVYNKRSETLIGGHQKGKIIPKSSKIVIEKTYDEPTKCFTIAEGYVDIGGEKFKYREVFASPEWEAEAVLAANGHGGEWDIPLLNIYLADHKISDLKITGLEIPTLESMGVNLDYLQSKKNKAVEPELTDEEYVAQTEQTTEQIPTESINNSVVSNIQEKAMDVIGRRYVIIIDCTSNDHKAALKEKISSLVIEAGGKFF